MKKILLFILITLFMIGCDTKEEKQAYQVLRKGVLVDSTETHKTYKYGGTYYMFYQLSNDVWYMRRGKSIMREQPKEARKGDIYVDNPVKRYHSYLYPHQYLHHYFHHHH